LVDDRDPNRRLHRLRADLPHADAPAEMLLQRAADHELGRRGLLGAGRSEQQLVDAGAEVGAVHPLTGIGKEDLLDQIAEVLLLGGLRGALAAVEVIREVELHRATFRSRASGPAPESAAFRSARRRWSRIAGPPARHRSARGWPRR